MNEGRLHYSKPTYYSNKVLIGNWFEENLNFIEENYKHNSLYRHDFTRKRSQDKKINDELRNNIQIKSECAENLMPPRITEEFSNYFDNFTTTYDLSYQYFPTWINGTLNRKLRFKLLKYEPEEEYLNSFGNLTKRIDLTEFKKKEWDCDIPDPRRTTYSTAQISFPKLENDAYTFSRWTRPTPIKVKCGHVTQKIYKGFSPDHPRSILTKCNPISWECKGESIVQDKCVCNK